MTSCTMHKIIDNTEDAPGIDGGEWTEVPSHSGSSSSAPEEAAVSSTETIVEVTSTQARGLCSLVISNTRLEAHLRGWKKGSGKSISLLVLKGGTTQEREDCGLELQRLMPIFAAKKGKSGGKSAKTVSSSMSDERPTYTAPAPLFFGVVKRVAEESGFKCHPMGFTDAGKTVSKYGLSGKTLTERNAIAQQVTDHCVELLAQTPKKCPASKAIGALKMVLRKPEFEGIEFCIVAKTADTWSYILIGSSSEQIDLISHAVTMQCVQWIMRDEEEAEMDFYTVPADQAFGALNATYKAQFKPSKWGGVTKSEQVEYELKGYTDKKRTLSRYILTGGSPKSQAAFVAKVNSCANKYKRGDKAKATVAKEAAVLSNKDDVEYAKHTNEQRDPEGYFEREAKRKATMTKGKAPKARGSVEVAYAGSGPAEENPFALNAKRITKQEKQAAQAVRVEEKQREAALEKQKAEKAATIKAELEKQKAAEVAKHAQAIAATNPFAEAFGVDSDDEDVEEPPRTAEEDVTHGPRAVTPKGPGGLWGKGTPTVKVVEKEFSQPPQKAKGKAKTVAFPVDQRGDYQEAGDAIRENWDDEWFNE
jgi:hypothetical protein